MGGKGTHVILATIKKSKKKFPGSSEKINGLTTRGLYLQMQKSAGTVDRLSALQGYGVSTVPQTSLLPITSLTQMIGQLN